MRYSEMIYIVMFTQAIFWDLPVVSVGGLARDFTTLKTSQYKSLSKLGPMDLKGMSNFFTSLYDTFQWTKMKVVSLL